MKNVIVVIFLAMVFVLVAVEIINDYTRKRKMNNISLSKCKLKNNVAFYLRCEGWADSINEDGEFVYDEEQNDEMYVCNRVEKVDDKYHVFATYISSYYDFLDDFPKEGGSCHVILTQQMFDDLCNKSVICTDSEKKQFPTYLTVLSMTPKEIFESYENEYG